MSRKPSKVKLVVTLVVLIPAILMVVSYRRDERLESFINDFNGLTDEIVKTIEENTTSAGITEAQGILNAKKAGLKSQLAELKLMKGSQISEDELILLRDSIRDGRAKMSEIFTKNSAVKRALVENAQFLEAAEKLLADYKSIIE